MSPNLAALLDVLVVEDDPDLNEMVGAYVGLAGYGARSALNGADALRELRSRPPALVLLDLMLPDIQGTEVCKQLKSSPRTKAVPVIMLTARSDEVDRVVGFELGADDFVAKPFSVRELMLRVKAVLRRGAPGEEERPRERVGPVRIDPIAHRAFVNDAEVELTALEFKLLGTFMSRLGRVQTRETLLQDVWEMSAEVQTRTVDTHVKRLREKLGDGRDLIETVRGVGYRMIDPTEK